MGSLGTGLSKLNILFAPDFDQNQYVENIYNIIECIDAVAINRVKHITPKMMRKGFNHYDFSVVHWLENWLVNGPNDKRLTLRSAMRFLLRLFVLKIISKRVIYVRHNIYPHSLNHNDGKIAKWLTDLACKLSDVCVVHSGHLDENYTYIPHPLYKFKNTLSESALAGTKRFVMFGRIIEYKAIDKLLEAWGKIPLLIAGSVGSKEYVNKLQTIKAERQLESVEIDARFLSNEEAQDIVAQSSGLILAHCEDDMIVSGSFFFAASLGVPVYAVKTPFLSWLKLQFNYSGLYVFDTLSDLVEAINSGRVEASDRKQISAEAQKLFGDQAIKQAFEKVLLQ
jgi:beta-1,4-mannosyltransferase